MDLQTTWFILIAVLLTGYAILDGFDLGVGILSLFAHDDRERRIYINAIGPVWDGNEVWLLTGGGALFAAFPAVYATVFSGFYLALMLLLVALIFRAVSMEFRGKVDAAGWRALWDWSFGLGSLLPALLLGVAFGNILRGVPLNGAGNFAGSFLGLLNPYAILVGLVTAVLFTMHGALYLTTKTDGALRDRLVRWVSGTWIAFVVLHLLATGATILVSPFLFAGLLRAPVFWILFLLLLGAVLTLPVVLKKDRFFGAFLLSSVIVLAVVGLSAVSLFPYLVPSLSNLTNSLTIYNASSSHATLAVMLMIALIGMPLVLAYTFFIYRAFKGKVVLSDESY